MKRISISTLCFLLIFVFFFVISAMEQKVIEEKPIQKISWLEGKWVKAYGDKLREEHFSFLGGEMMAMCREISNSGSLIEVRLIGQEGEETVMRTRHFTNGIKLALEEKDKTAIYILKEYDKKSALFAGKEDKQNETITYKLLTKDLLEITVVHSENGNRKEEIYRMKRV